MAQENLARNLDNQEELDSAEKTKRLEALKHEYERRVNGSKLGGAEKRTCLDWLKKGLNDNGQPIAIEDLEVRLQHFAQAEAASLRLVEQYREKVEDFIRRGILPIFTKDGKSRLQAELDWFSDLPYEDFQASIDKRRALLRSDIDDPERIKVLEVWERLPRAFREKQKEMWDRSNLEDRKRLAYQARERHEALKTRFLKLSPEIQERERKKFKAIADFDKREILLIQLEEMLRKQRERQRERQRETGEAKKKALKDQQGNRALRAKGNDGKRADEKGETNFLAKAKAWFLSTLRKLTLSGKSSDAEAIETFAIANEVGKRRKRAELNLHAKTARELRGNSEESSGGKEIQDFVLKTRALREHRSTRETLKRRLRPSLQDKSATLTGVKLVNDEGREMTADEFTATEVAREERKVRETVLRQATVVPFDKKIIEKAAKEITEQEIEDITREAIRKAA